MNRILIAGYGKMGSWLWSLFAKDYDCAVYETKSGLKEIYSSVNFLGSPEEIISFKPDLFINCVNLNKTIDVFRELLPHLPKNCVIADIASVKKELPDFYAKAGHRFASVHPMFGPTFTDMNNPAGRSAYVISESDAETKKIFIRQFEKVGILTHECSFTVHEMHMAQHLSVPILLSIIFAGTTETVPHTGTTFEKYFRLTEMVLGEDPGLQNDILSNPYTREVISKMIETLTSTDYSILNGNAIPTGQLLKLKSKELKSR